MQASDYGDISHERLEGRGGFETLPHLHAGFQKDQKSPLSDDLIFGAEQTK